MNTSSGQINRSQANYPTHLNSIKSLANPQAGGAPGQANIATECARWLEKPDVSAFYNAVMNGTSGQSQANQNLFMEYYRYAYQTAFGAGNAGSDWGGGVHPPGQGGGMPQAQVPPGAKLGPNGNIVYNQGTGELTFTDGVAQPIDVFSDQFTLNVSVKAKVDIEKTKDTRTNPAVDVYKVTINDPASNPTQTVLFVSEDTALTINTIGGKKPTFHGAIEADKLPDGKPRFTVGTFSGDTETGETSAESSMKGVADKTDPSTIRYTPEFEGETIDFRPKPGTAQTHVVTANASIDVKPGDRADLTMVNGNDVQILITHQDGTTDKFIVKVGYLTTLMINKQNVYFNGKLATEAKVPEPFAGKVQVPSLLTGAPTQSTGVVSGIDAYKHYAFELTASKKKTHVGGHTGK